MDTQKVKTLRQKTGISFAQCKEALDAADNDLDQALAILKEKGAAIAEKKASRELKAGTIVAYIHQGMIGAMVELQSETDFVSKNPEFKNLADELAMQVAAVDPTDAEALLASPYIKEPDKTVSDLLQAAIQKFGERVEVSRFVRFSL